MTEQRETHMDDAADVSSIPGMRPVLASAVIDQLEANRSKYDAEHRRWQELWHLWLGVGNGAGLLGVAGVVMGTEAHAWRDALVLSAWCFAVGVAAGGALPILRSKRNYAAARLVEATLDEVQSAAPAKDLEREGRTVGLWKALMEMCVPLAVAAFAFGVLVPLVSITLWEAPLPASIHASE